MVTKIFLRSLGNSRLIGLTFRSMISCSSLPPSSFEECLNKKQLVPGLAVVQRRPKLRFFSQGIVALVSGLIWLTVCLTVGPKASILAECKWALFRRLASTSIASSHVPDTCSSSWIQIGDCCSYAEINDRLFVNPGRNDNIQDTLSKVKYYSPEYWQWVQQQEYMWHFVDGQVSPVQIKMEDTLAEYRDNPRKEKAEIALHTPGGKKRWKTKEGTYQLKHPEHGDQTERTMPTTDAATFAEMLRDV